MSEGRPGVWRLIREDRSAQREGFWAQGFWALAVYRLSHRRLAMRQGIVRRLWGGWAKLAGKAVEWLCGISLPEGTTIGRRLRIEHFGGIIVHSATVIGDDCLLRQNVTLGNRSEARPLEAPIIGDRVQVGAGAVILGAVRIGDDAIIGANAVVLIDVPAGGVAVGNPARLIR
ncbi:serine O-acetyltransferase [Sphingobium chlorophenolicum L-1]|uniref:Serine acetyltransferase n=1 Tax=Sphingobium chlorophenolicum L-1 TaxID=690566 RepID=F6EX18_SPHCR|nr:DapH/DapD/GlmU-related protein [Sphingobium chlorophenolicum]AEG48181.1 serine O-acetyltransferase [Sphingobium chlorophenolicum L-1]